MDEKKPRIDSFKQFLRQVSRARHFAWGAGDVQHLPAQDKSDRSGHMTWHAGDVQHLPKKIKDTLGEEVDLSHLQSLVRDPHPLLNTVLHPTDWANQGRHREAYEDGHHISHSVYKNWSPDINDPLRGSGRGMMHFDDLTRHVGRLDHITSLPLEHDTHVYRGFQPYYPIHQLTRGHEFIDHGFTGTTLHPQMAVHFGGFHDMGNPGPLAGTTHRVIAKIHLPAGTKGHLLDHPDYPSAVNKEGEFLLHRGTRFKVLGHALSDQHESSPPSRQSGQGDTHIRTEPLLHVVHMKAIGQENE